MKQRTFAEALDALYAGIDSDSGIRDHELWEDCVAELEQIGFPEVLDILWDISVELYSNDKGYTAEDRLEFIQHWRDEIGV